MKSRPSEPPHLDFLFPRTVHLVFSWHLVQSPPVCYLQAWWSWWGSLNQMSTFRVVVVVVVELVGHLTCNSLKRAMHILVHTAPAVAFPAFPCLAWSYYCFPSFHPMKRSYSKKSVPFKQFILTYLHSDSHIVLFSTTSPLIQLYSSTS